MQSSAAHDYEDNLSSSWWWQWCSKSKYNWNSSLSIRERSKTTMVAHWIVDTWIVMASTAVFHLSINRLSATFCKSKISSKCSITVGNTENWFICSYKEKRTVSTNDSGRPRFGSILSICDEPTNWSCTDVFM